MTGLREPAGTSASSASSAVETDGQEGVRQTVSLALVFIGQLLLMGAAFVFGRSATGPFVGYAVAGLAVQMLFLSASAGNWPGARPPDFLFAQLCLSVLFILLGAVFLVGAPALFLLPLPALALTLVFAARLPTGKYLSLAAGACLFQLVLELWLLRQGGDAFFAFIRLLAVALSAAGLPALVRCELLFMRRALLLRNRQLEAACERMQETAGRDELTGCHNRRYLFDELWPQGAGDIACTLLYVDIDYFKRVNDLFGHTAGDRVLCDFAALLVELAGADNPVARLGGDEFLLLLRGADQAAGEALAARLTARLRELQVDPSRPDYRITVSMSLVGRLPDESLAEVMELADRGLYAAKKAGRNRLVPAWRPGLAPVSAG